MAQQTAVTIASATTTLIGIVKKQRGLDIWRGSIGVAGTFGGTTVTFSWSPDGGTTKHPITTAPGTSVSITAATSFNIELGAGDKNSDGILLYATTTGGAGISITVQVVDNN